MSALLPPPSDSSRPSQPSAPLRADGRVRAVRTPSGRGPLMLLAGGSLALHLLVVSGVVLAERSPSRMPPHEIAVEIVQEPPRPKPEPVKPEARKPEPKPVAHQPAATEPAEIKPPALKTAAVEPPKPPPAPVPKAAPPEPKAAPPERKAPVAEKPAPPSPQETRVAELQKELAALKAEHDALAQAAMAPPTGSGPLDGFSAAALPGVGSDDDAEAASYQALVFSQLAKAKGIGRQQGKPGTAGVRFEVDDEGKLVSVDVVSQSGVPSLDAEALDIVKRASPFLPPPKGAQRIFMANFNFVPQGDR